MICNNILQVIGNTPMVRVNNIIKMNNLKCDLLVKCEFLNPGGSIKDRIGKNMVEKAYENKEIDPTTTLIEPTSGNTGIGLGLACSIYGNPLVITLPNKMSSEKANTMKALGAKITRTDTNLMWDDPNSHIGVAKKLNKEIDNSRILDQYTNPNNWKIHYDVTGEEIYKQTGGNIDYIVIGAGTGGTLTGVARKLKEKIPNIKIIGVDPEGSILADGEMTNDNVYSYQVEGIGYDFIPDVLDRSLVDKWYKVNDKNSFLTARMLIRHEGLLCGGSSGSAFWVALELAKTLKNGEKVVVILPDGIKNYMSKFLDDNWMKENNYM